MKKNRTMVVIALAIVLTLSIGYALFSQTINITGTATAQGSFEFTPTCTIGVDSGIASTDAAKATEVSNVISNYNSFMGYTGLNTYPTTINGSSNNTCTIDGNNVTMSSTLAYPGAMQLFTVKVTNTGTISGSFDVASLLSHAESGSVATDGDIVAVYIAGQNRLPSDRAQVNTAIGAYANHEYVTNEVLYVMYAYVWPSSGTTSCNGGSNCTRTFTFTLPFAQYNQ